MVEIQLIPIKKIRLPKGGNPLSASTVGNLMDSIRLEGMYNPIIVRPDPNSPGCYLVVQGRHRWTAKKNLKEEVIECRVFEDMDNEEADLAACTENACRFAPNATKRLLLIQKWQELFRLKFPDMIGKKASGKASAKSRKAKTQAAAEAGSEAGTETNKDHCDPYSNGADADPTGTADPIEGDDKKTTTFKDRVAAATGQSRATVTRDLRIANGFTEEQLRVIDALEIPKLNLLMILEATKNNVSERAEVVNLVCSGMPTADAIKEVTGISQVKDAAGRTKEAASDAEAKEKLADGTGSDLTDDEWFEIYCGEFAKLLADPDRYKEDAIFYRQLVDDRAGFRKKVKKKYAVARDRRKGKSLSPFFAIVYRLLNASHPKDWLYCDQCKGTGKTDDGKPCRKCMESGYFVKTEKYLSS